MIMRATVPTTTVTPQLGFVFDCNTTKTPLWRSGPKGPKSLCNACGIRQRKARRAPGSSSCSYNKWHTFIFN
ncbi:hypothetical protein Leryth_019888 [Lithospermum erythrorhizon]|nr:hypothetical protein Leryth_019888 [Lithospermum erythrorhizon]